MHWLERCGAALLVGMVVVACRPTAPSPQPSSWLLHSTSEPPAEPEFAPVPTLSLEQRLDAHAVGADDFVRRALYTWTTPAQIEALRAGGPLLVADGREHPSPFNRLIHAMVQERRPGHALAELLEREPGLTKRRYTWSSPFATVLGKGPRSYGEALIRVELSPRAIIARLDPTASPPWSFRDARGQPVDDAEVLADPHRLGAVYHLRVEETESIPFREWVLCNEAMVARWSVGTPQIAARIEQERQLVRDLAAGPFAALPPPTRAWRAWPQWIDPGPAPTLLSRWHRALAFDNQRYRPAPETLARIDAALAAYDPTGPALVGGSEVETSR